MEKHTVKDRISFFNHPRALRQPAFKILDAVQKEAPELQILSLAVVLKTLTETLNISAHDILVRIGRGMGEIDGPFTPEIQAIRAYARGELK